MNTLEITNLSVNHGNKEVLKNINLSFQRGELYGILGPNGAGKSTLFGAITNQIKFKSGKVYIEEVEVKDYKIRNLAQKVSLMSQNFDIKFPYTVTEIMAMGRYSYNEGKLNTKDKNAINQALTEAKLEELKFRAVNKLSGGERQRVLLGKTLCQDTDIVLIDEGFSNMDIYFQIEFIKLLKEKAIKENKLIIFIMHDLMLARKYCHKIVILKEGSVYNSGMSKEILNDKTLKEVFRVSGRFINDSLELI